MVFLAVLCAAEASVEAQSPAVPGGPDFAVMLLDQPQRETVGRVWLAFRNSGQSPRLFCRSFWSYTWISNDPNSPAVSGADSSVEGCGDGGQGPSWVLLPGEWRFDSVEVKAPPDRTRELQVVVGLIERTPGRAGSSERTVSWSRPVSDAIALGDKLKAGQFP